MKGRALRSSRSARRLAAVSISGRCGRRRRRSRGWAASGENRRSQVAPRLRRAMVCGRFAGVFWGAGRPADVNAVALPRLGRIRRPCPSSRSTIAQAGVGRHAFQANNPPNRVASQRFDWLSSSNNINKTGTVLRGKKKNRKKKKKKKSHEKYIRANNIWYHVVGTGNSISTRQIVFRVFSVFSVNLFFYSLFFNPGTNQKL